MTMKTILHASKFAVLLSAIALSAFAATPLTDVQMSGANNQVKSGATLTIKSGGSFVIEGGGTISGTQPLDATLTAWAAASTAANKITYWSGTDAITTIDFSPFSQTLLPLTSRATWLSALMPSSPSENDLVYYSGTAWAKLTLGTNLSITDGVIDAASAPVGATYVTQGSETGLTNEFALGSLATGLLKVTTGTGALDSVTTSAGISDLLSDESGSGALLFGTSPTITTPTISGAITFPDGVRQTFNPNGTNAGINVGANSSDPSSPSNGDIWYDSTNNTLDARINGATVSLGGGGGSGDVAGPSSATDNALARFDGTTGKTIQDSAATLADTGVLTLGTTAAGGLTLNNTSTQPPYVLYAVSGSNKALIGAANQANDIVTGSAAGDLVLRTIGTNLIRFSVDNGTTSAVAVNSTGADFLSSTPKLKFNVGGSSFENYLVVQPSTTNAEARMIIAPNGTATNSSILMQSNSSVDTTGSEVFGFGGGFSGAVSGSWNFGSFVYASTNADSRPISFTVSNTSDGRIEAVRILNTGQLDVKRNIASTSTTTGALTVAGGVGIAGSASIGSLTTITANGSANALFLLGRSADNIAQLQFKNNANSAITGMVGVNGSSVMTLGTGASATTALTINASQQIQFNAYGAGTATFDAAGNVTASSDESLKDIQGNFSSGLAALRDIQPIAYKWKATTGMDRADTYYGFSAQNVMRNIPEAVGMGQDGKLTLQDRALLAVAINAINELRTQNVLLTQLVKDLANTPADKTRADAVIAVINAVDSADKDARVAARKAALEAIVLANKSAVQAAKNQAN
jgi:hypothetical protein